ncbi:MAG TPA: hypothetical protein VGO18_04580 [Steroidobacteraceae bacterium]|jgi:hypothetical protein|nr:hypothetical protein [Steroidobacteraceae bacterium]
MRRVLSSITTSGTLTGLFLLYAGAAPAAEFIAIPTGQTISPTAAPGSMFQALNPHVAAAPDYTVGQAEMTQPGLAVARRVTPGLHPSVKIFKRFPV